jgi:hypothetical protein
LRNKNKRLPTTEEFLQFIPKRLDFEWSTTEDNLVQISVPKFTSNLGKTFCQIIKKNDMFTANLDKIGSFVWKNCDGKHSVKEILHKLEKVFPDEKNLQQRLFLFLNQMKNLNYLEY